VPGLELDDAVLHAAGHSLALAFDKVGEWHPCCHSSPTIDCQVRTCRFGWRVRYGTGQQAAYLMPMDGPRSLHRGGRHTRTDQRRHGRRGNGTWKQQGRLLHGGPRIVSTVEQRDALLSADYSTITRKTLSDTASNRVANPRAGIAPWNTALNGGASLSLRAMCRCPVSSSNVTSRPLA
jgi:hypothetical protein